MWHSSTTPPLCGFRRQADRHPRTPVQPRGKSLIAGADVVNGTFNIIRHAYCHQRRVRSAAGAPPRVMNNPPMGHPVLVHWSDEKRRTLHRQAGTSPSRDFPKRQPPGLPLRGAWCWISATTCTLTPARQTRDS